MIHLLYIISCVIISFIGYFISLLLLEHSVQYLLFLLCKLVSTCLYTCTLLYYCSTMLVMLHSSSQQHTCITSLQRTDNSPSPHPTAISSTSCMEWPASRGGLQLADHGLPVQVTLVVLLEGLQCIIFVFEHHLSHARSCHGHCLQRTNCSTELLCVCVCVCVCVRDRREFKTGIPNKNCQIRLTAISFFETVSERLEMVIVVMVVMPLGREREGGGGGA